MASAQPRVNAGCTLRSYLLTVSDGWPTPTGRGCSPKGRCVGVPFQVPPKINPHWFCQIHEPENKYAPPPQQPGGRVRIAPEQLSNQKATELLAR
jgi:hypothetical protein